jgi:hypothetical protein
MYGLDGNGRNGLPELPQPGTDWRKPKFSGTTADVLHGGTTHLVTRIATNTNLAEGIVRISYEVAAENSEMQRGILEIDLAGPA